MDTTPSSAQPVAVEVIAHPRARASVRRLERGLFARFCAQPLEVDARPLRIPVLYRGRPTSEPPDLADVGSAAVRTLVVALMDAEAVLDDAWRSAVADLALRADGDPGLMFLPVALTPAAVKLPHLLALNMVRAYQRTGPAQVALVEERVAHALYRLLAGEGAQIFLSHAKQDGVDITSRIRDHLQDETQVDDFFDTHDIPDGSHFAAEIEAGVEGAAVLVVLTDAYSTREWCRVEVLAAKRSGVPVVLVDALDRRTDRLFPYLGAVPVVRWRPGPAVLREIVLVTLIEILRGAHIRERVGHVAQLGGHDLTDTVIVARPPELASLALAGVTTGRVIYPDPPIGECERELLAAGFPELTIMTPTELLRRRP